MRWKSAAGSDPDSARRRVRCEQEVPHGLAGIRPMSAFGGKADMVMNGQNVRF